MSFPAVSNIHCYRIANSKAMHNLNSFSLATTKRVTPSLTTVLMFTSGPASVMNVKRLHNRRAGHLRTLIGRVHHVKKITRRLPSKLHVRPIPSRALRRTGVRACTSRHVTAFTTVLKLHVPSVRIVGITAAHGALPSFINV